MIDSITITDTGRPKFSRFSKTFLHPPLLDIKPGKSDVPQAAHYIMTGTQLQLFAAAILDPFQ